MLDRLQRLFRSKPKETRLQAFVRSMPPERIAAIADRGGDQALASSIGILSVSVAADLLGTMGNAGQPLHAYLSSTSPDVIIFEACAFLLWSGRQVMAPLDHEGDDFDEASEPEGPELRFVVAAAIAGEVFGKYAGFPDALRALLMRGSRYRRGTMEAGENLIAALLASAGRREPHPVLPRLDPLRGDIEANIFVPTTTMVWLASMAKYFIEVSTKMAAF